METGIIGQEELIVNEMNTAEALGSGSLAVFATPAMIERGTVPGGRTEHGRNSCQCQTSVGFTGGHEDHLQD